VYLYRFTCVCQPGFVGQSLYPQGKRNIKAQGLEREICHSVFVFLSEAHLIVFFSSSLKTVATPSVFQNMELALSLGDTSKPFKFLDKTPKLSSKDLGFCMGLGSGFTASTRSHDKLGSHENNHQEDERRVSSDPPLQLVLLPFSPVPRRHQPPSKTRFPWLTDNCNATFFELILFFNSVAVFRILVLFIFLMC